MTLFIFTIAWLLTCYHRSWRASWPRYTVPQESCKSKLLKNPFSNSREALIVGYLPLPMPLNWHSDVTQPRWPSTSGRCVGIFSTAWLLITWSLYQSSTHLPRNQLVRPLRSILTSAFVQCPRWISPMVACIKCHHWYHINCAGHYYNPDRDDLICWQCRGVKPPAAVKGPQNYGARTWMINPSNV